MTMHIEEAAVADLAERIGLALMTATDDCGLKVYVRVDPERLYNSAANALRSSVDWPIKIPEPSPVAVSISLSDLVKRAKISPQMTPWSNAMSSSMRFPA